MLAKETPECFDRIKAREFALRRLRSFVNIFVSTVKMAVIAFVGAFVRDSHAASRPAWALSCLDNRAIRNAHRGNSSESIRRKPLFLLRSCNSRESPQTCDLQFSAPRNAVRKKGVQIGNSQATRVNLRIDSRESRHLSSHEHFYVSTLANTFMSTLVGPFVVRVRFCLLCASRDEVSASPCCKP